MRRLGSRVVRRYSASRRATVVGDPGKFVDGSYDQREKEVVTQVDYEIPVDMRQKIVALDEYGYRGQPKVSEWSWIAPDATVVGNVELWDYASIWYGSVVRGDRGLVRIGHHSNIQDGSVISECLHPIDADHDGSTIIGHFVTIGHRCFIRGATVEDRCLVGMGSVLSPGSYMESDSMLGAGSVLAAGQRIPSKQLWVGNPAKYVDRKSVV